MTTEQKASHPEGPFQTGRILLAGTDIGWSAHNDGTLITLTRDEDCREDPLELRSNIDNLVSDAPVMGDLFTYNLSLGDGPTISTIPTIETLNAFGREIFAGLPTAGIELVQTAPAIENDRGEAFVTHYVPRLRQRQQVASSHPKRHLHDLLFHFLGSRRIEEREFTVFEKLAQVGDTVGERFGAAVQTSYTARLGSAFDLFSGFTLAPNQTLPGESLHILSYDYTHLNTDVIAPPIPAQVLAKSRHIVEQYHKDPSTSTGGNRIEYYQEVAHRLRQKSWLPSGYTLPKWETGSQNTRMRLATS